MSTVASPAPASSGGPHRWTVDRYLFAVEAGLFGPEDRVEMLEGEIVRKMGQDFAHIDGIRLLVDALRTVLGTGCNIDARLPIKTPDSVPEPDITVLQGTARDYVGRFPRPEEIVLVAEVANTSLREDRLQKVGIYARAGITEYWILNVVERQLEVHRRPLPTGVYAETRIHAATESVTLEGRELAVADLLP